MRRVVVTGMGAVTPIGIGVDTFWENVKKKTLGFGEITRFDTTDYKVHIAAEVKDFAGKDYMDFKAAKRMELFCQYAVAAAKEAFEQAGLDMEKEDPFRVGCSIGSGIGSLQAAETACHKIAEKGPSRVNPLLVPLMISNMAAGNVSIQLGLKGKSLNVVTACATGTHSIGEAYRSIQCGDADVMLAGGLSWERDPEWLFWKNWSMRNSVARRFLRRLSDMVQPVMRIILLRRQRTVPGLRKRWNWHWKKRE